MHPCWSVSRARVERGVEHEVCVARLNGSTLFPSDHPQVVLPLPLVHLSDLDRESRETTSLICMHPLTLYAA